MIFICITIFNHCNWKTIRSIREHRKQKKNSTVSNKSLLSTKVRIFLICCKCMTRIWWNDSTDSARIFPVLCFVIKQTTRKITNKNLFNTLTREILQECPSKEPKAFLTKSRLHRNKEKVYIYIVVKCKIIYILRCSHKIQLQEHNCSYLDLYS